MDTSLPGKIRLIGEDYLFRALSQVLDCVDGFSWETKDIQKEVVISELSGLHQEFVLQKIFQWFFIPQNKEDNEGKYFKLLIEFSCFHLN